MLLSPECKVFIGEEIDALAKCLRASSWVMLLHIIFHLRTCNCYKQREREREREIAIEREENTCRIAK